jgi:DNA adenine methylase
MPKSGPLKWHGGKSYLAPKIIDLMPPHTRYCEPFFGGGAVMLQKPCEGVAEFANDLNINLMHFWYVLSEPKAFPDFYRRAQCKPLSEPLFDAACERLERRTASDNGPFPRLPEDAAVDFFVVNRQSRQALGRDYVTPTCRLRRGMNEQVSAWLSAVDGLPEFHERLRRVEIRCMDAEDFIRELDSQETCFYCDPPYIHETRSSTGEYGKHEMTLENHADLLLCLSEIKGKFLLSGYRSTLYDDWAAKAKWRRVDFEIPNQASSKKQKQIQIECVWVNF